MGIKKEATPEVFVAGLRTYKSETLDRAPREGTEPNYIERLWRFLEKLVARGSTTVNNKIAKIDIIYNGRESGCNCGAIIYKEGATHDTEERLAEPCTCRGAQGIVVFEVPKAAVVLRNIIKTHRELHKDGQRSDKGVAKDGSIHFCETCCFDNRKIKSTTVKPVASTEEVSSGEETVEEGTLDIEGVSDTPPVIIITEEQLSAAATILAGALGLPFTMQVGTLIAGTKGADRSGAYTSIVEGVREIFENPLNKKTLPTKFSHDQYKSAISGALSYVLISVTTDICVTKATEWVQLFNESKDGTVKMPETVETGENGNAADTSKLLEEREDINEVVSKEDLNKQYGSIEPMLSVCKTMDIEAMGETTAADTALLQLRKLQVKAVSMYVKLDEDAKLELKDQHTKYTGLLVDAIKQLQGQINLFKFTKGDKVPLVDAEKMKNPAKGGQDMPTKTEINQDIKKFESSVSTLEYSIQEVEEIINDEDIEGVGSPRHVLNRRMWGREAPEGCKTIVIVLESY